VLQPGKPGEQASEVDDPGQVAAEDSWNHADVIFMQMMVSHHGQALEMSKLATKRAGDERVRTLAARIHAAQGPEIILMAEWLRTRDFEVPRATDDPTDHDHSGHGHTAMAGMLSAAEMRRLGDSRGREFDRLYLRGMIAHHQGAVAMVDELAPQGLDVTVSELAADVVASQAAEITRMEDLLRSL
jgi:uncharacterized protein (DUF305 family)